MAFDCGLGVGSLDFNQVQIYTLSWNPQLLMLRMSIKLSAPPQHTTSNYQLAVFRNSSSTGKLQMSLRGKKNPSETIGYMPRPAFPSPPNHGRRED